MHIVRRARWRWFLAATVAAMAVVLGATALALVLPGPSGSTGYLDRTPIEYQRAGPLAHLSASAVNRALGGPPAASTTSTRSGAPPLSGPASGKTTSGYSSNYSVEENACAPAPDFCWSPSPARIRPGDSVTWSDPTLFGCNQVGHTVTSTSPNWSVDVTIYCGNLTPGRQLSFTYTFTAPGTYTYQDKNASGGGAGTVLVTSS